MARLWVEMFDFWRLSYAGMDYGAHQEFYNLVARHFPEQKKYDADAVGTAVSSAIARHGPIRVFELGGWDGACALEMLGEFSSLDLLSWTNAEICTEVKHPSDPLYNVLPPVDWAWELLTPESMGLYQLGVFSHVIEHLSWGDLRRVIEWVSAIPLLYFQTPKSLGEECHPMQWYGTMSTHKIEVGWRVIRERLETCGYREIWQKDTCRIFQKRDALCLDHA